eukprot:6208682-Pleurochrysis_carterae.AAC.2
MVEADTALREDDWPALLGGEVGEARERLRVVLQHVAQRLTTRPKHAARVVGTGRLQPTR